MRGSIKKEWDDAAESWVDFVRKEKDYYRDELNNPATFKLIGDIRDRLVLDLACGEGHNTRILARKGAKVTGLDFSEKMIELAKRMESNEKLAITYYVSDAADMEEFASNHFDLVTCFMSLQDIESYENAISEVARVLKPNGKFIFSIPHPCFEWIVNDEEEISCWKYAKGTENTSEEKALHMKIKKYFGTFEYEVPWTMKRLIKPFKTTSFHRTLTDYFQALHESGMLVSRLVEPRPISGAALKYPSLKKVLKIPHSVIIEAIKR